MTLQVTALGTLLAFFVATVSGTGRLSRFRTLRAVSRVYIEVFRGTSLLVQMFWFFFALPLAGIDLSPMTAGVLAIGLNLGAYGGEVVRGAMSSVPSGSVDAAIALNFSPRARRWRIIWPQALVRMIPPFGNLLVQLLKATSLVSLITIGDLVHRANLLRTSTGQTVQIFTAVLVLYFLMSRLVLWLLGLVEARTTRRWALEV